MSESKEARELRCEMHSHLASMQLELKETNLKLDKAIAAAATTHLMAVTTRALSDELNERLSLTVRALQIQDEQIDKLNELNDLLTKKVKVIGGRVVELKGGDAT